MIQKNKICYKKQFGQHFLLNKQMNEKIVGFAFDQIHLDFPGQAVNVFEIGPGGGHLSEVILEFLKPKKFVMIEKDFDLEKNLIKKFSLKESQILNQKFEKIFENSSVCQSQTNVHLIFADALKIDFEQLILNDFEIDHKKEKICIIANLPYNIGTKLLLNFFEIQSRLNLFDLITVLIQKEVAQRFVCQNAAIHSSDQSQKKAVSSKNNYEKPQILSSLIFEKSLIHFQIGPKNFTPPPKVDSSLTSFVKNENLDLNAFKFEEFIVFLNSAFCFPRKMLLNNLKNFYNNNEDSLKLSFDLCQIDLNARPSNLSPIKYLELFHAVKKNRFFFD